MLVNWNNRPARNWGAADDNWSYGSVQRVKMLDDNLNARGKHDLASVTSAMNAAATSDLRSVDLTPVLDTLLKAAPSPSARATRMLALLDAWHAAGSSRLDVNLDGVMDAGPGPAIWDALYPRLYKAIFGKYKGLTDFVGTDSGSGSDFTGGGFWYVDKTLGPPPGRSSTRTASRTAERRSSARRRSGRRWIPSPATPTPSAPTRTPSGSRSVPACSPPRSASPTARVGSSR